MSDSSDRYRPTRTNHDDRNSDGTDNREGEDQRRTTRRLDESDSLPSFENPFRPGDEARSGESAESKRTIDESVYRSLYGDDAVDEDEFASSYDSTYEQYARAAFDGGEEAEEDAKPLTLGDMNHPSQLFDEDIDIDDWDEDLDEDDDAEEDAGSAAGNIGRVFDEEDDEDKDSVDGSLGGAYGKDDESDFDEDADEENEPTAGFGESYGEDDEDEDTLDGDADEDIDDEDDIEDDFDDEEEDEDDFDDGWSGGSDESIASFDATPTTTMKPVVKNIGAVSSADTTGVLPIVGDPSLDAYDDMTTFADIDYDREERCGFPEVIYGAGKTAAQIATISHALLEQHGIAYTTRVSDEKAAALLERFEDGIWLPSCHLFIVDEREGGAEGSTVEEVLTSRPAFDLEGHIVVCCAGTSDLPVAQEAAVTAYLMGSKVTLLSDIGVAGIHRTLSHTELLRSARVIVAVAGMEGALPSVIAGLVDVPVIAVPTSIGYGASFGGVAALLSMLSACASGVSVVNIDNGFGAGNIADRINRPPMRFLQG